MPFAASDFICFEPQRCRRRVEPGWFGCRFAARRARVGHNLNGVSVLLFRISRVAVNDINRERITAPRLNDRTRRAVNFLHVALGAEGGTRSVLIKSQPAALPAVALDAVNVAVPAAESVKRVAFRRAIFLVVDGKTEIAFAVRAVPIRYLAAAADALRRCRKQRSKCLRQSD